MPAITRGSGGEGRPRALVGVAVLLKIYTHCIDGQATAANQRIAEALGIQEAEEDLGDEGDGDRAGILKWQVRAGIRAERSA
jgi:hypothetical protein